MCAFRFKSSGWDYIAHGFYTVIVSEITVISVNTMSGGGGGVQKSV